MEVRHGVVRPPLAAFGGHRLEVVLMGGASYPKADGERRNRAERQLDWSLLPMEGRAGDPPELPGWREWTLQTRDWWAAL